MPHKRILIIDSSREVADKSRNLLEREKFEVEIVLSAALALNIIRERSMSLIVIDLDLEDMSGIHAVKAIRKVDKYVPMIAVHSQDSEEVTDALYLINEITFLKKPVEFEDIFVKIGEFLVDR